MCGLRTYTELRSDEVIDKGRSTGFIYGCYVHANSLPFFTKKSLRMLQEVLEPIATLDNKPQIVRMRWKELIQHGRCCLEICKRRGRHSMGCHQD